MLRTPSKRLLIK